MIFIIIALVAFLTGICGVVLSLVRELDRHKALSREVEDGLNARIQVLTAEARIDGPIFNLGRNEGRSDVAVMLRKVVDPEDADKWSLDGTLGHIKSTIEENVRLMDLVRAYEDEQIGVAIDLSEENRKLREQLAAGTTCECEALQKQVAELNELVEGQRRTLTDAFAALNDTKGELNAKQAEVLEIQKQTEDAQSQAEESLRKIAKHLGPESEYCAGRISPEFHQTIEDACSKYIEPDPEG